MINDELESALSREEEILPSSGFTVSVMDAVRREALTPAPIPFPWKRALPGMMAAVAVFVSTIFAALNYLRTSGGGVDSAPYVAPAKRFIEASLHYGAGWIVLALILSITSIALSMRVSTRRI